MNYFAIQVKTRDEEDYIKRVRVKLTSDPGRILFPRRTLTIRKHHEKRTVTEAVFPGYVFLETDSIDADLYWTFRKTDGFFRFLKSNRDVCPLSGEDKRLLVHFISFGEIADKSVVSFDENDRIIVLSGPMKNLEGHIVKVDKRKGRAKIRLTLCGDKFLIDLGFEVMEKQVGGEEKNGRRL
jgi:transcriptional antiterminator NusG